MKNLPVQIEFEVMQEELSKNIDVTVLLPNIGTGMHVSNLNHLLRILKFQVKEKNMRLEGNIILTEVKDNDNT